MSLSDLPPWLAGINPAFYQSALEAGAKTGLAVADQAQRAQQIAEARAEREAQARERQEAAAERQREFDSSHLLNVQKVAQDAAQLQQQIAHQTAQEKNQALQESRLLDYQTGRLGLDRQKADLADRIANKPTVWVPSVEGGAPGHFELRGGGVNVPREADAVTVQNKARVGTEGVTESGLHFVWLGPNQIRVTDKSGNDKDLTPNQLLSYADKFKYSTDPATRATVGSIQTFIGEKAKQQISPKISSNAPTVLATNAPVAVPSVGATGPINPLPSRKSDLVVGKLYDTKRGVARWNGTAFEKVP
jgi:multidrug efflux pump subunit AcrA (membrane-fusion protein)